MESALASTPLLNTLFALIHVEDLANIICESLASNRIGISEIDDSEGGHDWRELADLNRAISGTPNRLIYLPKPLADAVAFCSEWSVLFTGQYAMFGRGKVNELYHKDWVARGPGWPRANPIKLGEGLAETLAWYRANGMLPPLPPKARSAA